MSSAIRIGTTALLVCLHAASVAHAATASCAAPEFRQFDFWIGEWTVRGPNGKLAGTSRISLEYGGCVIHERYETGRGYSGESLNIYDAPRHQWHQSWVDDAGTLLLLDGGIEDGKMVLEGPGIGSDGGKIVHRITWTPNPDGTVRQFWESTDANGDWQVAFDGTYTRQ
jgi:hypothetical protein